MNPIELGEFDISVSDFIKYGNVVPDVSDPCLSENSYPFSIATTLWQITSKQRVKAGASGYELWGLSA